MVSLSVAAHSYFHPIPEIRHLHGDDRHAEPAVLSHSDISLGEEETIRRKQTHFRSFRSNRYDHLRDMGSQFTANPLFAAGLSGLGDIGWATVFAVVCCCFQQNVSSVRVNRLISALIILYHSLNRKCDFSIAYEFDLIGQRDKKSVPNTNVG